MVKKPTYEALENRLKGLKKETAELNQALEALQESQEKYRSLVESTEDSLYLIDRNSTYQFMNKKHMSRLGVESIEVLGKTYGEFHSETDTREFTEILKKVLESGQSIQQEHKAHTGRYFLRTLSPVKNANGKIESITVVSKDITERVQADEAMRESELRFRSLFDFSPQAIALSDFATGRLIDVNDTFCKTTNYSKEEVLGRTTIELGLISKKDRIRFINEIRASGEAHGFEMDFRRNDGSIVNARVFGRTIQLGKESFIITILHNVTEQKRLEAQVQRAQKMAALGTLVAGMAHEINNPNNVISINAPMVHKAWQSIMPILENHYDHNGDFSVAGIPFTTMRERIPQLLAGILDGSNRIEKIVSDLKHFAQPDASTPFEPVDVNSVVKSSLTLLSNLLKKSTDHFRVEYGNNIPKVNGNYQHLEQVVVNLVQNACQALPDKNKEICVSTSYQETTGTIRIQIQDQGAGIPAESLDRIMDPFFTTRRSSGGTGLGLSVSSSIIEEHDGELTVTSEEGRGTTFTVILPSNGKKGRIKVLVVDDDKIAREMIVAVFAEDAAFSVEEACDGMDACLKLGIFRPDLLILDIQMPDMNGVEVCRRIKATPDYSNLKVLVVTGFIESEDAKKIAEMGFTHFCTKPVSLKDFQAMVQEVLNSN